MNSDYVISCDRRRIDASFVVSALRSTYWAGDRLPEVILQSIERSLCFGAYHAGSGQVGFARVVTDGCTFSWLCDVYVTPDHRKKGVAQRLICAVLEHPDVCRGTVTLGTKDAHALYEKFGFVRWEHMRRPAHTPNQSMEPTVTAVTPRADARGAPAATVAHH